MAPILIDGSHGEGGGAMLRTALGFSMLLQKPFEMTNIRIGRPKPGLSWQHLAVLNAAHQACDAHVQGNKLGATSIAFAPGPLDKRNLSIDIGTAGSVTLCLQAFLLPALFGEKPMKLHVKGGTDVAWSIPADYFANVLVPQLRKYADITLKLARRGYYPKGGGEAVLQCTPRQAGFNGAPQLQLTEQGTLFKITGISHSSTSQDDALQAAQAARLVLAPLKVPLDIQAATTQTDCEGSGITLWATCGDERGLDKDNPVIIGASALGTPQQPPRRLGEQAALALKATLEKGSPVDEHLADQLIPILALVGGTIRTSELTPHLLSNIYVAEAFLGERFTISGDTIASRPFTS